MMANPITISLEDAPLIIAALLPQSDIEITWLRQTSLAEITNLPVGVRSELEKKSEWILRQYHALQKHDDLRAVAPHVLPYLAKVNLQVSATKSELVQSIETLKSFPLTYTLQLADSLSESLKVQMPDKLDLQPDRPGAIVSDRKRIRLVEARPLNQFELILPSIYGLSDQTWLDTSDSLDSHSFDKKESKLRAILDTEIEQDISYRFEMVVEPQVMREIQSKLEPANMLQQRPTPAHGYNVSKVQDGGMIERCFDLSYELFSQLQSSMPAAAPLICLYGHRQRFLMTVNYHSLQKIYDRKIKLSKPALNVIKFIRKEISLKHPIIHDWFENKEEIG